MMTLKLASWATPGMGLQDCPAGQMWIAGVQRVKVEWRQRMSDVLADMQLPHSDVSVYHPQDFVIWCDPSSADTDFAVTLLWVQFQHEQDAFMLVEKAWLLGPDGQTIERIAP